MFGYQIQGRALANIIGKPTAPIPTATIACVPTGVQAEDVDEIRFKISPSEITAVMK